MPFKLKLKKSRQYNVSTKNLFVLSVELLDNTTVECTLSSQSNGQECLSNVCQRLGLQQPQYFGLRFLSKKGTFWWVDLQRPLKKQLDKYALEYNNLYLGVMFFVADVNILHDEVTRYHYFLQLKSDILEGKLHCNENQTILFASYSLQAEFGDHDPERHTTEYLTNFGLLPKQMALPKEERDTYLDQVILSHRNLQGMSQQLAEVYYIMEAQRLSGYGLECFAAKDGSSNAVIIGVSLMGIYIWYLNNQPSVYFPWDQILNLVHHKRCFGIEHNNAPKVLQIHLEDSHLAKYVWKTCIQQHSFYRNNAALINSSANEQSGTSRPPSVIAVNSKVINVNKNEQKSSHRPKYHLQESQESLDGLGVYHTENGYSEVIPPSTSYNTIAEINAKIEKQSSSTSLSNMGTSLSSLANKSNLPPSSTASNSSITTSISNSSITNTVSNLNIAIPLNKPSTTTPLSNLQPSYSQPLPQLVSSSHGNLAQLRRVSLSDATVHHRSQQIMPQHRNLSEPKPICSVLPVYRQAPDYDTAVKLKYGIQSGSTGDMSASQTMQTAVISNGSQVDLSHLIREQQQVQQQMAPVQSYSHYKNYADLSHLDMNELLKSINICEPNVLARNQDHFSAPTLHPPVHTYSSPDLASQSVGTESSPEQMINPHLMYQFKPPPPYPYKQKTSSSTPDLSSNHQIAQLCSSQDLILLKNLGLNSNCILPIPHQKPNFQIASSYPVSYLPQKNIVESFQAQTYTPTSVSCAKIITSNVVPHQTIVSSQKVNSQGNLPVHTYQNYNPTGQLTDTTVTHFTETAQQYTPTLQDLQLSSGLQTAVKTQNSSNPQLTNCSSNNAQNVSPGSLSLANKEDAHSMGPMLMAAMNGLTLSRPDMVAQHVVEKRIPNDTRIQSLESRLAEGQVFLEFERIIKKKPNANYSTAIMPENLTRNRFKDVFPYEENRVRLTPTTENKTGYINASLLNVSLGSEQRFYIAAQGPLPNTLYSFWQMIWEHHVSVIVMLTEVQEQGRDKCFPYWPQEDGNKLQIGEFQIIRNFSMSSPTYVTCSLSLCHMTSHQQRSIWHIQYTDWPDHSCPQDIQGFIAFMGEVDAVRRHSTCDLDPRLISSPIVVHCSAGVGRSGAVILCDIMLHCLDHNQPLDLPKVLTHLRLQRMLTVQTLAQYKFVYSVLIQYLRNSRLI